MVSLWLRLLFCCDVVVMECVHACARSFVWTCERKRARVCSSAHAHRALSGDDHDGAGGAAEVLSGGCEAGPFHLCRRHQQIHVSWLQRAGELLNHGELGLLQAVENVRQAAGGVRFHHQEGLLHAGGEA